MRKTFSAIGLLIFCGSAVAAGIYQKAHSSHSIFGTGLSYLARTARRFTVISPEARAQQQSNGKIAQPAGMAPITQSPTTVGPSPTLTSTYRTPTPNATYGTPTPTFSTPTPTIINPTPTSTNRPPTPTLTQISPTLTPTRISPTPTPTLIAPTPTATNRPPTPTPTQVSPTSTPTRVIPTPSPTGPPPTSTPTNVSPTLTPTLVVPTPTNGPSPTPTTTITLQPCSNNKGGGKFRQVSNPVSGKYIVVLQSDVPPVEGTAQLTPEPAQPSMTANASMMMNQRQGVSNQTQVTVLATPVPVDATPVPTYDGPSPIPTDPPTDPPTQEEQVVSQTATDLTAQYGGSYEKVYASALKGFSALLSEDQARAMSEDTRVEYIEEDAQISVNAVASWGLDRIDQRNRPLDQNYKYDTDGRGVNVYVIDTGLRATHQDFGGRASMDANFTGDNQFTDCNGHGTHVSGTIGSSTYGVAKGTRLHGVKVLGCNGNGDTAGIVAGVNYVAKNRPKNAPAVANMSLGGGVNTAIDDSVRNLIKSGVTVVVAAGNDTKDAGYYSPARVCEAITVGATDYLDNRAEFSNFGPVLDLFAPGEDIVSTWNSSDTATNVLDGTSMAAPHVTGVVARYLQTHQTVSPAQVESAITTNATANILVNNNIGPSSPNLLLYSSWDNSSPNGCGNPVGDHAAFDGQSVPLTVVAGRSFTAAFAMKNTGSTVWTNASEYGLASVNTPVDLWGYSTLNKVAVPDFPGVVPCSRLTFAVTATAPLTEGYYNMQWQMSGPNGFFGQPTPVFRIHVLAPNSANDAQQSRVQVAVPDRIRTGQVFNATVVMRNTGTTTWTQGANYYLQSLNGDSTWSVSNNLVPGIITPNNEAIFFLTIKAPSLPNVYAFRWQMTQNGVPFGDPTDFMTLNVHPGGGIGPSPPVCDNPLGDHASFVAQTVPLTVVAGRYFQSAFAMQNSGSTLWTNGYDYGLASVNNPPELWGPGTSFNPVAVADAPGLVPCGNMTFIINTKAPDYAGDYYMQWQMRGPGGYFGHPTPLLRIHVVPAPPADDAHYAVVSVQTPNPIRAGQQFQAVISMYNMGTTTWTRSGNYYLQPLNGVNLWGITGVYVPTTIPPGFGQVATWNLTLTAPSTPGRYAFRWQMAHSYQAFGDPTDYFVIDVQPPP